MDQEYISDRKPISLLQKEEPLITETDKYEELLTTFDMYRSVGDTY